MAQNDRRCVSCRRVAPKAEFWRVVRVYPDRRVMLDAGTGRSAYLCPQADCLRLAQKKNRLGRALKVQVPELIFQQLWQRLETFPQPLATQPLPSTPNLDSSSER